MRLVISGTRNLGMVEIDREPVAVGGRPEEKMDGILRHLLGDTLDKVTEVYTGNSGFIDTLGRRWAHWKGLSETPFDAEWQNLSQEGAVVKTRSDGSRYNSFAGKKRNIDMAKKCDLTVAIWDGRSRGTAHMIKETRRREKPAYIYLVMR